MWVWCRLDVASIVDSLARCCVLRQVPRIYVCSYVYVCVLVCEREYILCELLGVGLVSAGCCVHCRQPGKMLRLTSGTPHNVCTCVCVCVCVRERERLYFV